MGTIRFEIRTDKKDKAGQVPIRLIYQVAGQRVYFNAGKKLMPQCWDAAQQRAIYLDKKTAKKAAPAVD
jgi:Arm DNA-binding domain